MPYAQVSLAVLRQQLRAKWDDVPFWTDTEANAAINEALHWYNIGTGVWRRRVALTTVADQVLYNVPAPLWTPCRVDFNSHPMQLSSIHDLDNGRPDWQSETTATTGAPTRPVFWAPVGMTQFAIWPADAVGNNGLILDGVLNTPVLTTDGAMLDLDDSEIDPILGEALHIATFKDPARWPRTQGWHQEFLRTLMAHNGRLNASDLFRQATVDQQRSTSPPARLSSPS